MKDYVESSLELHLFFARIMKEHAFFLEVGFTKANESCMEDARWFKEKFEDLLFRVIQSSEGVVGNDVFASGEAITAFTLCSEQKACRLTGAHINDEITKLEETFADSCKKENKYTCMDSVLKEKVKQLNESALCLLDKFIEFQKWLTDKFICCEMTMYSYPALVEHITHEAELYESILKSIESNQCQEKSNTHDMVEFWCEGMKEHSATLRGLLDPAEDELFAEADMFVSTFSVLVDGVREMEEIVVCPLMSEVINDMMELRDYKAGLTKGINDCLVRSMILPLLADHVLREANFFLRLLMNP